MQFQITDRRYKDHTYHRDQIIRSDQMREIRFITDREQKKMQFQCFCRNSKEERKDNIKTQAWHTHNITPL